MRVVHKVLNDDFSVWKFAPSPHLVQNNLHLFTNEQARMFLLAKVFLMGHKQKK